MKCPICSKEIAWEGNPTRPFCSDRCRLIDLGNWASGKYALPVQNPTADNNVEEEKSAEN